MLMIRKDFHIIDGALIIQKKLIQEFPTKASTNNLSNLKHLFDNKEKLLNARKLISKSSNNFPSTDKKPSLTNKKRNNYSNDEKTRHESETNTTTFILNKKLKMSKRGSKNSLFNKPNVNSSTNTKKLKPSRSVSSHETSKISFNNSSIITNISSSKKIAKKSNTSKLITNLNYTEKHSQTNSIKLDENKNNTKDEPEQLDKRQRFDIYMKLLESKPNAKSMKEAISMINSSLDEIEEKHAPKKDDKVYGINSKKYGRMYPVPVERIKVNPETGKTEMLTTGLTIVLEEDGSFDIWTLKRGNFDNKKIFHKNGSKITP